MNLKNGDKHVQYMHRIHKFNLYILCTMYRTSHTEHSCQCPAIC